MSPGYMIKKGKNTIIEYSSMIIQLENLEIDIILNIEILKDKLLKLSIYNLTNIETLLSIINSCVIDVLDINIGLPKITTGAFSGLSDLFNEILNMGQVSFKEVTTLSIRMVSNIILKNLLNPYLKINKNE